VLTVELDNYVLLSPAALKILEHAGDAEQQRVREHQRIFHRISWFAQARESFSPKRKPKTCSRKQTWCERVKELPSAQ